MACSHMVTFKNFQNLLSGEGRNQLFSCITATWIPAFAGMTKK
jgi:hypothetical protein